VRTAGDPESLAGLSRQAVRSADASQPVTLVRSLDQWLNTATAYESFSTFLFGIFGGVALLLAAVGVFGIVSYSVEHANSEYVWRGGGAARCLETAVLFDQQASRDRAVCRRDSQRHFRKSASEQDARNGRSGFLAVYSCTGRNDHDDIRRIVPAGAIGYAYRADASTSTGVSRYHNILAFVVSSQYISARQ
jgi:hypothetical protein